MVYYFQEFLVDLLSHRERQFMIGLLLKDFFSGLLLENVFWWAYALKTLRLTVQKSFRTGLPLEDVRMADFYKESF